MLAPEILSAKIHWHIVGPVQWRFRKRRLRRFVSRASDTPPVADLHTRVCCDNAACAPLVADTDHHLTTFNTIESWVRDRGRRRPTACLLNLSHFSTFAEYAAAVSKKSKGNDNRRVKAAVKKGYTSRIIHRHGYDADILNIQRSKFFRTGGLVLAAVMTPKEPAINRSLQPEPPACHEHWMIAWGVFTPIEMGDRLVAYAWIRRTGNFVLIMDIMGHGEFLRDGVVKLLMFDIVKWLLDRRDPCVQSIDHLKYGSMEDGGQGLLEWKRRMLFTPFLLR